VDIFKRYGKLTKAGKWSEALPLIEEIVSLGPEIPTSHFNYGVCLEALGRHPEAAREFLEAYRLDPADYHAQYRAFRSLQLGEDWQGFLELAQRECETMPEIVDILFEEEEFSPVLARPEFTAFRQQFGR